MTSSSLMLQSVTISPTISTQITMYAWAFVQHLAKGFSVNTLGIQLLNTVVPSIINHSLWALWSLRGL
ncbi:hypothetical protein ACWDSJ_07365 [Nocardia sp. NPDC003482]